MLSGLLQAEGAHGVDGCGSVGRNKTSHRGHGDKEYGGEKQREGIAGTPAGPRGHDAVEAEAEREADGEAGSESGGGRGQDQANDAGRLRAEAHANTHFLRALGDGVGDNAVEAGGGEGKRENGKEGEERGDEALAAPALRVEPPIESTILPSDEFGVDFAESLFDRPDGGGGIAGGTGEELNVAWQNKTIRKKDGGADGTGKAIVARVAHNADDFEPIIGRLCGDKIGLIDLKGRAANVLTDGIGVAEKLFDERLIDEGEMGGTHEFGVVEHAAGDEGDVKSGKDLRTDKSENGLSVGEGGLALEFKFGAESPKTREPGRGDAGRRDAGSLFDGFADIFLCLEALLPGGIGALRECDVHNEDAGGVETERSVGERLEGLDGGTGTGHE